MSNATWNVTKTSFTWHSFNEDGALCRKGIKPKDEHHVSEAAAQSNFEQNHHVGAKKCVACTKAEAAHRARVEASMEPVNEYDQVCEGVIEPMTNAEMVQAQSLGAKVTARGEELAFEPSQADRRRPWIARDGSLSRYSRGEVTVEYPVREGVVTPEAVAAREIAKLELPADIEAEAMAAAKELPAEDLAQLFPASPLADATATWGRTETGNTFHSFYPGGTAKCRKNIEEDSTRTHRTRQDAEEFVAGVPGFLKMCKPCVELDNEYRAHVEAAEEWSYSGTVANSHGYRGVVFGTVSAATEEEALDAVYAKERADGSWIAAAHVERKTPEAPVEELVESFPEGTVVDIRGGGTATVQAERGTVTHEHPNQGKSWVAVTMLTIQGQGWHGQRRRMFVEELTMHTHDFKALYNMGEGRAVERCACGEEQPFAADIERQCRSGNSAQLCEDAGLCDQCWKRENDEHVRIADLPAPAPVPVDAEDPFEPDKSEELDALHAEALQQDAEFEAAQAGFTIGSVWVHQWYDGTFTVRKIDQSGPGQAGVTFTVTRKDWRGQFSSSYYLDTAVEMFTPEPGNVPGASAALARLVDFLK